MHKAIHAVSLPLLALLLAAAGCWWLTVVMAVDFTAAADAAAMWQQASFAVLFVMWAVMMAAMMLPSFIPTFRIYHRLLLTDPQVNAAWRVSALAAGYLLLWLLFSAAVALIQQTAAAGGMLNDSLAVASPYMQAMLLAAAGGFQFTPLKMKCLNGCRHPAFFFMLHWRGGLRGAFLMGVHNGLLCAGCCALLMLLLFVGGVMNLYWIVLLTLYVLLEKTLPLPPRLLMRVSGALLLLAAVYILFTTIGEY